MAAAETIHAPAAGATFQEDSSVYFDWAWDNDQYATSAIYFAQTPDPKDPNWYGPAHPGRIAVSDGGYSFTDSHATVQPNKVGLTPGGWYWRLCSKSIDGEDDKCQLRMDPQPIAITAAPAPPPAPVPAPPVPAPPVPSPAPQAAAITRAEAEKAVRVAIRRRLNSATPRGLALSCRSQSRSTWVCAAKWANRTYRWKGTSRIVRTDGGVTASVKLTRVTKRSGRVRQYR
jgi:hypothetical protein